MGRKKDKPEIETAEANTGSPAAGQADPGKNDRNISEITFSDSGIVTFKKVLNGYKPSEVDEYIALLSSNLAGAQQVFDAQSADLKSNLAFITRERDKLKEQIASLEDKTDAYKKKCAEYEQAMLELDEIKAKNAQLQSTVNNLYSKLELCKNLAAENRECRNKAAEIEIERKHMEEQKALLAKEITELREENTRQAYSFAEQKKDIEAQYLNQNLRRAEHMQMHTYHIRKSDELLNELVKQFKLAVKSLEDTETT